MPLPLPPARMGSGEARKWVKGQCPLRVQGRALERITYGLQQSSLLVLQAGRLSRGNGSKGRTSPTESVRKSTLGKIRQYIATGIRIHAHPTYRPYCVDTRVLLATTVLHKRSLSAFLRVPLDLNTISPNRLPSHGIVLTIVPPLAG